MHAVVLVHSSIIYHLSSIFLVPPPPTEPPHVCHVLSCLVLSCIFSIGNAHTNKKEKTRSDPVREKEKVTYVLYRRMIIISNRHALVQFDNGGIGRMAVVMVTTDIDVFGEQLVRHLVFLQDVVVCPRAREGGAEEEAEDPAGKH